MYCNHVIPRCLFQEVSIMRKSCQVIVGNLPIGQGGKVPTIGGALGLLDTPRDVGSSK